MFVCNENTYVVSLFFLNRSIRGVIPEEQKSFLYPLPPKLMSRNMCLLNFHTPPPLLKQIQVCLFSYF